MPDVEPHPLPLSSLLLSGWQNLVDVFAELAAIPSVLVLRAQDDLLTVVVCSQTSPVSYQMGECVTIETTNEKRVIQSRETNATLFIMAERALQLSGGAHFGTLYLLSTDARSLPPSLYQPFQHCGNALEAQLAEYDQQQQAQAEMERLHGQMNVLSQRLEVLQGRLCEEKTRRQTAEEEMLYRQRHDHGTGFLNRYAFEAELNQYLHTDPAHTLALVHIGFSNAYRIRSKYGDTAWDQVLVQYRDRLGDLSSYGAIIARTTPRDLVLLIRCYQLDHCLYPLIQKLVELGHQTFFADGEPLLLHSFIGVAKPPMPREASLWLKHAFEAMLAGRHSGETYCFYSEAMSVSHSRLNQLESYLLQAVRNDELLLYFQPKVSPQTQSWSGAEALLRWKNETFRHFSNETLINLAEKNGLIFEIGQYVLDAAIQKAAQWVTQIKEFKLAVNISAVQLANPRFAEQVKQSLQRYQLPAANLELEVTESSFIVDEQIARQSLEDLHQLGVTLSLDDFGTGFSSFDYLKKYPFDAIKIDKSFIFHLDNNEEDKEIVRSIVSVAKKLNLQVTVEGVETQQHEQFIVDEGCHYGQGYFYARPMPIEEFEIHLFKQHQGDQTPE